MNISRDNASSILDAVQGRKVPGGNYGSAAMALASVLAHPDSVNEETPGISWVDELETTNWLLLAEGKVVHAVVPRDGAPHAAAYSSPVGTVEAAEIREVEGFGAMTWYVDTWHVTMQDGTVITLRSGGNDARAEDLAGFVRGHLLP